MARIATLAFHPEGSKIAFRNHNVVICPPTSESVYNLIPQSLLQGIDRYWNSDSRNDLHILNHVIKNFIDLYVIPYKEKDEKTYKNLINLAKYTCVGLMKLQRTYSDEHCNAVLVVQLYINTLRDLIRDSHDPSSFYTPGGVVSKPLINEDHDLTLSTIFDIEKFKTYWSKKELDKLCQQFNGCFKNQGEVEEVIFAPSDTLATTEAFNFLIRGDLDTRNVTTAVDADDDSESIGGSLIDLPVTTSASHVSLVRSGPVSDEEFTLPEPSNQSLPIVKGLVVSIIEILNAMDKRFTAVLTQSMQGLK